MLALWPFAMDLFCRGSVGSCDWTVLNKVAFDDCLEERSEERV
jgi:hypothetical protein